MLIDIIILSFAKSDKLKQLTEQTIDTLLQSERDSDNIKFNVIVIESEKKLKPYQYDNTLTIYPKVRFGFNRYLNIGIKTTHNPYICICNNDLIFQPNWATEMLKAFAQNADLVSASPVCSVLAENKPDYYAVNSGTHLGYGIRKEVSGWCIMFKRSILNTIGYFDENYHFWYSDNDYANTLEQHGLKHALVTSAIVDHLESSTLNGEKADAMEMLTHGGNYYHNYKWQHKKKLKYIYLITKYRLRRYKNRLKILKIRYRFKSN